MRTLTCWQLHPALPSCPALPILWGFQSLWSGKSVLFVCVFSGDNDVFQDPGHCFPEPQNQLGPLGRQPALPCSSEREMCPQGQNRASEQEEGQGSWPQGWGLGWRGPPWERPLQLLEPAGDICSEPRRQDRPRVIKTTLALDSPLPENSSHLGSQESPGPSGQPKARTSSPHWAFVPVVSLHPILPEKALKNITLRGEKPRWKHR